MLIRLKVHPDSKKDAVERLAEDRYELWVRAPAEDNRANAACLGLMGRVLGLEPKRIRIVKGARSPSKIIEVPEP